MNAARQALTRAVNRAIAEGAPIYVNQPAPYVKHVISSDNPALSGWYVWQHNEYEMAGHPLSGPYSSTQQAHDAIDKL